MKNQTSFEQGNRSTGRAKGAKNKRTILKESVGLATWQQLEDFINNEGAELMITSMKQLRPGQYVHAYIGLVEYFKPKLSRQQLAADGGEVEVQVTMNLR